MAHNSTIVIKCKWCNCDIFRKRHEYTKQLKKGLNIYCSKEHMALGKKDMIKKKAESNIGSTFGKLKVTKILDGKGITWTECLCECGESKKITLTRLMSGRAKGCGCGRIGRSIIHGASKTKLYQVYRSMLQRCYDSNCKPYKNYGGRGITVCDEWRESFIPFRAWALGSGYRVGIDIDRENNDGNYEPDNCRWVSRVESVLNRRVTHKAEYLSETKSISEWSNIFNVSRLKLDYRVIVRGLSMEQALKDIINITRNV